MAQQVISQGWECPKCGKVYAPTQIECTKCPIPATFTTTSNAMYPHQFERNATSTANVCKICGMGEWGHPIITQC